MRKTWIAAVLLVAACGSGRAGGKSGPGDLPLPELGEVVDSAALAAAVEDLYRAGPAGGTARFAVHFDSAGSLRALKLIESEVPSAVATRLEDLIRRHVRTPGAGPARALRLEVAIADPPRFAVQHPGVTTRPEFLNRDEIARIVSGAPPRARASLVIALLVDETGAVAGTRIIRTSGDRAIDAFARNLATAMRFRPGAIDGVPVPLWIEFPITFDPG